MAPPSTPWTIRMHHLRGERAGQVCPVPSEGGWIGRSPDCAVQVDDREGCISRHHVHIQPTPQAVWVHAVGRQVESTLNGTPLTQPQRLSHGDVLGLGAEVSLRVELREPLGAPESAPRRPWSAQTRRAVRTLAALAAAVLCVVVGALGWWSHAQSARAVERDQAREEVWRRLQQGHSPEVLGPIIRSALTPAPAPRSEAPPDALSAHVQQVLEDLTGERQDPPDRFFLEAVRQQLPTLGRGCACRLAALREELETLFAGELARIGAPAARARWLIYIAWVESCYNPMACSPAAARGMWQFIPKTGRIYGLTVNEAEDHRCDWRASTRAAARYFAQTFAECGDQNPLLAIAAYNTGEKRACAVAKSSQLPEGRRDMLAFYVHGHLPLETFHYVPRFLAATFLDHHREEAHRLMGLPAEPLECSPDTRIPPSGPCPDGEGACIKQPPLP